MQSNVEEYKICFITKGFTQRENMDYKKTFSLLLMKDSLSVIMTLVIYYDLELCQMEVKTIFLNRDIEETINIVQLESIASKVSKHLVCILKKFIYGLK